MERLKKNQIFLGEKRFKTLHEVPRSQRFAHRPTLKQLFSDEVKKIKNKRNDIPCNAFINCGYTLKELADFLDIHYTTVSNIISNHDKN